MASLRHQINRFKTIIIILVILIIILLIVIIRRNNNFVLDPSLNIETVQVRNVENIVTAEGNIHGKDERIVYFPLQSKVKELKASINQNVSKDDVVAVVEVSSGQLTNSIEVKSPINGTITQLNYKEGDIANSTTAAFEVVDLSEYKLVTNINETDISDIKVDQKAKATFPAISLDDQYDAVVNFIAPSPLSTSGVVNYEVDLKPEKLPGNIKLGMSADIDITTAKVENVLAIPETYLIEKDNKIYVKVFTWKDENHTQYDITEKEVQIGLKTNEYIEVKTGLSQGDQIVEPSYIPQKGFGLFGN